MSDTVSYPIRMASPFAGHGCSGIIVVFENSKNKAKTIKISNGNNPSPEDIISFVDSNEIEDGIGTIIFTKEDVGILREKIILNVKSIKIDRNVQMNC